LIILKLPARVVAEMLFPSVRAAKAALDSAWRWPHFSIPELSCRCGGRFCQGRYWHDPLTLTGLEAMRSRLRRPIVVNSAHRCPQWNARVGGAPLSKHKKVAIDISLFGHDRFLALDAAKAAGFSGLGLAQSFLHVDRRERPAQWYYKGSRALWAT
jgi:zinc D-Ala-D-Ala carboxypeptidase